MFLTVWYLGLAYPITPVESLKGTLTIILEFQYTVDIE